MVEGEEFAHGYHYGDYSGVTFYGPPTDGFWFDRLAVSDCYMHPLFCGILDRGWRENGGERMPHLVSEWNTLEGWAGCGMGRVPVSAEVATEFAESLVQLGSEDVIPHCAGCTAEECLRCATLIHAFIMSHLARKCNLFIEDD